MVSESDAKSTYHSFLRIIGESCLVGVNALTSLANDQPIIVSYLGRLVAGNKLFYRSSRRHGGRGLMSVLAVLIAASMLLFVRNVFGVIYGLLAARPCGSAHIACRPG